MNEMFEDDYVGDWREEGELEPIQGECPHCGSRLFNSPSGIVCSRGHGGIMPYDLETKKQNLPAPRGD